MNSRMEMRDSSKKVKRNLELCQAFLWMKGISLDISNDLLFIVFRFGLNFCLFNHSYQCERRRDYGKRNEKKGLFSLCRRGFRFLNDRDS
jgi:hypothetical protein